MGGRDPAVSLVLNSVVIFLVENAANDFMSLVGDWSVLKVQVISEIGGWEICVHALPVGIVKLFKGLTVSCGHYSTLSVTGSGWSVVQSVVMINPYPARI